jgi:hypothetical protein
MVAVLSDLQVSLALALRFGKRLLEDGDRSASRGWSACADPRRCAESRTMALYDWFGDPKGAQPTGLMRQLSRGSR